MWKTPPVPWNPPRELWKQAELSTLTVQSSFKVPNSACDKTSARNGPPCPRKVTKLKKSGLSTIEVHSLAICSRPFLTCSLLTLESFPWTRNRRMSRRRILYKKKKQKRPSASVLSLEKVPTLKRMMTNLYTARLQKVARRTNFLFGRSTSRSKRLLQFSLQRPGCLNGETPFLAPKRRRPGNWK